MVKNFHSRNKSEQNSIQSTTFYERLNRDTQRQVSYKTRRLERKMKNLNWVDYVLKAYHKVTMRNALSIDNITRYGLPKNATYYVECHDQIKAYLNNNNNSISKEVAKIYNMLQARNTGKLYTKMDRYNLRVPRTISPTIEPKYNGERIHIKLEEVLSNGL